MIRTLRPTLVLGLLGFAACGVGGGGTGGTPDAPAGPPDSRDQSITCTATVTLSGTFTAPAPLDPAGGCQPDGTWQVTATVADKGTCATVPLKTSYSYVLTGVGHDTKIMYGAKAAGEEFQGNVESTGDGACSGFFEHIQPDGGNFDQLQLHPLTPKPAAAVTTLTIGGTGDFNLWSKHP